VITEDFNRARSEGTLDQFFNGTDSASSLAKQNAALTEMIARLTVRHNLINLCGLLISAVCHG
jgi:hypothetical protein